MRVKQVWEEGRNQKKSPHYNDLLILGGGATNKTGGGRVHPGEKRKKVKQTGKSWKRGQKKNGHSWHLPDAKAKKRTGPGVIRLTRARCLERRKPNQ